MAQIEIFDSVLSIEIYFTSKITKLINPVFFYLFLVPHPNLLVYTTCLFHNLCRSKVLNVFCTVVFKSRCLFTSAVHFIELKYLHKSRLLLSVDPGKLSKRH